MHSQALTDAYTGRRIIVTGATGFIGARLTRRLAQMGPASLRVLVRGSSSLALIEDLDVDVQVAPLEDTSALAEAVGGFDYVFHLAGLTRARTRAELMHANRDGTANLVRATRAANPGLMRFVHVSSQAAMGPNPPGVMALSEDAEPAPVTWYGESKLASEGALKSEIGGLPWSIVRPPGVYGPGEKDFLSMFRMVNGRFAPVIGFADKHYSLVFSEDLVAAILEVGASPAARGRAYFAADPAVHTSRDLLHAIERALGRRAWKPSLPEVLVAALASVNSLITPLLPKPPLLNRQKLKELLPPRWVVDTSRLADEVGFICGTGLDDAVRTTVDWYREKGWL